MADNGKRVFGRTDMLRALAGGLLILTLIFVISPAGMLWPLGSWVFMLFGCVGFYFFNAFLLATSTILLAKGGLIKKYFSWMQFLGFAVLLIGICTLSSSICLSKGIDLPSAIIANTATNAEGKRMTVQYYVDTKVGGGYLGCLLAGLLDVGGLNYVLSIACVLGGTVLFFFPVIFMAIEAIVKKAKKDSAINKSKKAVEKQAKVEQFDDDDFKPINFGEDEDQPTRVSLYSERSNPDTYREPVPKATNETYSFGELHEVKFGEEDDVSGDDIESGYFTNDDDFLEEAPAPAPKPVQQPIQQPVQQPIEQPQYKQPQPITPKPVEASPAPVYVQQPEPVKEVTPEPEVIAVKEEPAPYVAPTPAPIPQPVYEEEVVEQKPEPAVVQSLTEKDKFEAKLSLMSTENQIIVRDLHCDLAEELPPYEFPSVSLLKQPVNSSTIEGMQQDCEIKTQIINRLFQDMRIGAHVEGYTIGPSVTRFNIETDPNVRVSSIGQVINDLSKRLNGAKLRFTEVIKGTTYSGLEIQNEKSDTVYFKEMMDACGYGDAYKFHIPFGKSISGKYITGDLRKFPHMLVAGSTGSGKSIFIHGIIMSLIMKNRPEELKLVLVDPKRVEMALYKDLPHLLCPIIKDVTQVKVCLDKLIAEMERRNQIFEQAYVTNISQFNEDYAPENGIAKLPYIVLILDEFADAVDVCKNISDPVARLAQKARSAGIHIVLTTQRPTVDVVNGRIKANLPTTVALWVRSATDSCTILNEGGAENLAGHGDMLINCTEIDKTALVRAQGCMIWPDEIKTVCNHIRGQQKTHYDAEFLDLHDHDAEQKAFEKAAAAAMPSRAEQRQAEGASKYELIKEAVMQMEYVSISKIQREFGVGFPRAGKIMKQLQDEGVVAGNEPGQETNSKGSKVLIHEKQMFSGENQGTTDGTKVIPDGWDMPK